MTESLSLVQFTQRKAVQPYPKKIQGIEEMTPPEDKQQLHAFLGMVTYMGNFIPHLSHHMEPLRQLLKKDVMFYWDNQINQSFQQIKALLKEAQSKLLGYYDRKKSVIAQANASATAHASYRIADLLPLPASL